VQAAADASRRPGPWLAGRAGEDHDLDAWWRVAPGVRPGPVGRDVSQDHSRPGALLLPQPVICPVSPAIADGAARDGIELGDLLPHLRCLVVEKIECTPAGLEVGARWRPARAACPACGTWSSRVHSGYVRRLHDSPVGGRPVVIRLGMRRCMAAPDSISSATASCSADVTHRRHRSATVPLCLQSGRLHRRLLMAVPAGPGVLG
jgi:hypothetical protein